jgi:hypothetical protein
VSEASLAFLPLDQDAGLSDVVTAVYTTQGTSPPGLWFSWFDQGPGPATNDLDQPMVWLSSTSCAPSFTFPCSVGYGLQTTDTDYPLAFQVVQIPGFFVPE